MQEVGCELSDARHNGHNRNSTLPKPTRQEIEGFYRNWWLNTYMTPLNRTPMGIAEFSEAFYDEFCDSEPKGQSPGLTD